MGFVSHEFKKKCISLFFHDLGVEIFSIFKSYKSSGFFSLKSQTPKELIANAVYKYTYLWDTWLTYIRKTKRHFAVTSEVHLRFEKDLPNVFLHSQTLQLINKTPVVFYNFFC